MPTPQTKTKEDEDDEQQTTDDEETEEVVEETTDEAEEQAEETETDEEEVEVEEAEMPEDAEETESGEGGSLLSGSTFGISNKLLLGVGIAAVLIVLWLQTVESTSTTRDYDDEQVEEEVRESGGEVTEPTDTSAGGQMRYSEAQEEEALDAVFGDQ